MWFSSDVQFNSLYPPAIQQLSRRHWTPLEATRLAVQFLAPEDGMRILDLGSGAGKFCLSAAYYRPEALFYGVEQRKNLVEHAEAAKKKLGLRNVFFIHGNFAQLDLKQFDHFYFFNSFYENLKGTPKIDYKIPFSQTLYNYYDRLLFRKLEEMPAGTRVVTRCSWEDKAPASFRVVKKDFDMMLQLHIKE